MGTVVLAVQGNKIIEIPIWEKQNLTIEEAAAYSNIGINRLEKMVSKADCDFVLHIGRKRLIKKQKFDEFINSVDFIE